MIARSKQTSPPDLLRKQSRNFVRQLPEATDGYVHLVGPRWLPALVAVFGFVSFFPYPAVTLGNATALQAGNLLAILMLVPVLALSSRRPPVRLYLLFTIPVCISIIKVCLTGQDELALAFKGLPTWLIVLFTVVVTQLYAPRFSIEFLSGIAAATLVHVAVGALQMVSFQKNEFPLVFLYVNPQFLSVAENQETIAKYIQRPFGLFPEPSAMSSSLAPFVLFWLGQMCGVIRLRRAMSKFHARLFATAAISGLGLIIVSQSGHAAITLAAAAGFMAVWFWRSKATARTFAAIVTVFGIAVPLVVGLAVQSLSNRVTGGAGHGAGAAVSNGSWDERSSSLVIGFKMWANGSISDLLFGLGNGLSAPMISRIAHIDAVFSVSLTYIYETGFVGLISIAIAGWELFKAWKKSRYDKAFLILFSVWLVGVTLTTSYGVLLPISIGLGWFAVWPELVENASPVRRRAFRAPIAPAVARQGTWLESTSAT